MGILVIGVRDIWGFMSGNAGGCLGVIRIAREYRSHGFGAYCMAETCFS